MTVQSAAESTKLSFSYKFYWGLASLGTSLISGIYGGLLTIFYQDYLGSAQDGLELLPPSMRFGML
ncbi:MAG: hypothetical protein ACOX7C_07330 [Brevefilum sp.]